MMSLAQPHEPYSDPGLTEKRLATLHDRAQSDHAFLRRLARQKLRELTERVDIGNISIYTPDIYDPDALYEEQQVQERS